MMHVLSLNGILMMMMAQSTHISGVLHCKASYAAPWHLIHAKQTCAHNAACYSWKEWNSQVHVEMPEDDEEVDDKTKREEQIKEKEEGMLGKLIVPLRKLKCDAWLEKM